MARTLRIEYACNGCGALLEPDGKHVGELVAFGPGKPHELDLCDGCWGAIAEPLYLLYAAAMPPGKALPPDVAPGASKRGRPGAGTTSKGQPNPLVDCPQCGAQLRLRSGLPSHLTARHQTTVGEEQARVGRSFDGLPLAWQCDGCPGQFTTRKHLAQHRAAAHAGGRIDDADVARFRIAS